MGNLAWNKSFPAASSRRPGSRCAGQFHRNHGGPPRATLTSPTSRRVPSQIGKLLIEPRRESEKNGPSSSRTRGIFEYLFT